MSISRLVIIGGGPAGLMAAQVASQLGGSSVAVALYEAMPTPGRKFLLAGRGGLNLTHGEGPAAFRSRYAEAAGWVGNWLDGFDAQAVRAWAADLGVETFVGSSGRVFPVGMKAAPLLRAWLGRLRASGVDLFVRHRFIGWAGDGRLRIQTPAGERLAQADAVILAQGGASWPKFGADGQWQDLLRSEGIEVTPLRPANCGFEVAWSPGFGERFAGTPLKSVVLSFDDATGRRWARPGECVVTRHGLEGSLIYAGSALLRDRLAAHGPFCVMLDLLPGRSQEAVARALGQARGRHSRSEHLRRQVGLQGVKAGLLYEVAEPADFAEPARLAALIKALPVRLTAPRPLAEAISTAGGVPRQALDESLMLRGRPGVFCAGEMLDWEAPTGGYLLTACLASGVRAGQGAVRWLAAGHRSPAMG